MQKMGLNEIREKYLSFFESKGHLRLPSFSLIPQSEKSLLLINAGMAPMKPWFAGEQTPPSPRVTTCQKCIRTPDIERVGKTARHGTFFEMLGNFSFGDYFKREACAWAYEFCTEVMGLPRDRLYFSVYLEDDEAFDIWTKEIGVPESHMVRFGREDNFWEIGAGPCGPCSEIYFDRGEKYGCGKESCAVGCDCDRFVEFWNLVFTQFNSDGNGNYTPLKNKNIDTGMGLERIACMMQDVPNLFEVDTIKNIMAHVAKIAGKTYHSDEKTDVSLRVITDHVRSTTMLVSDGVLPSNEGRGYVLRRLLRRAARHGRLLGVTEPFLYTVAGTVIAESSAAYPELAEKADHIIRVIKTEEERFSLTIDTGLSMLKDEIARMKKEGVSTLSGDDAFRLYDTFGFPVDLTLELLSEEGLSLDEEGFGAAMSAQRERARAAHSAAGDFGWAATGLSAVPEPTVFKGYTEDETRSKLLYILVNGEERGVASTGEDAIFLLDETPFYAESGGQSADHGIVTNGAGAVFDVTDVKKTPDGKWLHQGSVAAGSFLPGTEVRAMIDKSRRSAIMRAHSATHLLQASIREVAGPHAVQAGSLVDADFLRFDFSHFAALTPSELARIELRVNALILEGLPVGESEMSLDEAKKAGALALFGEKYGEVVRVVRMGGVSTELCGGTHLSNTAQAGLFKIKSEGSVAAGVRRIEAVTGYGVLNLLDTEKAIVGEAAAALKASPAELPKKAAQVAAELKAAQKEIERLAALSAGAVISAALENSVSLGNTRFVRASFEGITLDQARKLGDDLRSRDESLAALFSIVSGGKLTFAAFCTKAAVKEGFNAGAIVRAVAELTGGKGGGRPDSASAGGQDMEKLAFAMEQAPKLAAKLAGKA